MTDSMHLRQHTSYKDILPAAWNALTGTDCPVLRHEYLLALETSGSATPATGWQPLPLLVEDDAGRVVGAAPLWLKSHSFGELVYDFAWAQAYERAGLHYYPKLIAAVPFSPIAGPRLLIAPDADRQSVIDALLNALLVIGTSFWGWLGLAAGFGGAFLIWHTLESSAARVPAAAVAFIIIFMAIYWQEIKKK